MSRIGGAAVAALVVTAAFAVLRTVGGLDLRAGFEALVVPASFLAGGVVGLLVGARRAVAVLVAAVGGLHIAALSTAAVVLALAESRLASGLNIASQALYGLGFAVLVVLAACYPGRTVRPTAPSTLAPVLVAVVLPVVGGLAGPSPTVLQSGERRVAPLAELLPGALASVGAAVLALPLVAAVVFGLRYRRAAQVDRRRMRWPMLGTALIGLLAAMSVLLDSSLPPAAEAVFLVAVPLLPLCIVLGAMTTPPADVDVLLRRGAVFGGTWAVAAAAYGIGITASAWAASGRALAATAVVGGVLSLMLATPVRRRLIALADERVRLQSDLAAQVDLLLARSAELTDSRRRLATATEAERIRIERDLHDGVQQEILAVIAQIEAARTGLHGADVPPTTTTALAHAGELARAAYETVRAVSTGVRPPVLEDLGLADAIRARTSGSPIPVHVLVPDELALRRWPPEVEGAAYFFAQECVANILKHSDAGQAFVELAYDEPALVVEVRDDGRGGLDPGAGTGLAGLRDRVEALGGSMTTAEHEGWTRLRATLPTEAVVR